MGSCNSRFEGFEDESNLLSMRRVVYYLAVDRNIWRIRFQKTKQRFEDNDFVGITSQEPYRVLSPYKAILK
jgi:hypothetical protein